MSVFAKPFEHLFFSSHPRVMVCFINHLGQSNQDSMFDDLRFVALLVVKEVTIPSLPKTS